MLAFGIGVGGCDTGSRAGVGVWGRVETGHVVGVRTPGESGCVVGWNARRRADRSMYELGFSRPAPSRIPRLGVNKLRFSELRAFLTSLNSAPAPVSAGLHFSRGLGEVGGNKGISSSTETGEHSTQGNPSS
jgi:hypothetical protein